MDVLRYQLASRVFAGVLAVAALACGVHTASAADAIPCAKADLVVTINDVKHDRNGSRSTVATYFTTTCKKAAVTAGFKARTKITTFTAESSETVTPDNSGKAVTRRVEQMNPAGQDITITVEGSDGDATSDAKKIPEG